GVFVRHATTVFVMDTSRSAGVAAGQLGIDREQSALQAGRRLVISSDFHKAYQSLACIDGVDPLWCFAHIRRYFLRAGAAHPEAPGEWAEARTERIAVLYRAHHALAATTPATDARQRAQGRWPRAVTATAARHDIEPLGLLTGYLHECARNGGAAPAGAGLDPFLSWTPRGRARRRPASDPGPGP